MEDLLDQIEAASHAQLYYVALAGALMIPDIAGALESSGGRATSQTYAAWFDRRVAKRYHGMMTGEDAYGLRCAMLQGRMRPHKGTYSRVLFLEPGAAPGILAHCNVLNNALNLDVDTFVNDVTAEARQWLNEVAGTQPFETNLAQSMRRHPNGMAPYIGGVSVIG